MVMTPYPFSSNHFENPSILVSRNGILYLEQKKGLNPLVPEPAYGYNNDPDIIFNEVHKTFQIYYLETMRPDSQNIVMLSSPDGLSWEKVTIVHYDLTKREPFIMSPAVVNFQNEYYMFYVQEEKPGPFSIRFIKSKDSIKWIKDQNVTAKTNLPNNISPWHLDVFPGDGCYYMLCCAPYGDLNLYLGRSTDLVTWDFLQQPIMEHSQDFYNSERIYRSSGVVQDDLLVVWFSIRTYQKKWKMGLKKYSLSVLFNE